MRGSSFDRFLAGSALALILTLSGQALAQTDSAQTDSTLKAIESAIPVPEAADVPPPTMADVIATPSPAAVTSEAAKPAADAAPAAATTVATPAPAADPAPAAASAATPVPAPVATAPAAPAADTAFADKLREFLAAKGDRYLSRKSDKAGIEAFYRARDYAPFWTNKDAPSARATEAIAYLRGVDADGLEPSEYPVPDFKAADTEALAEIELKFTNTILTFVRHAHNGRVHWSRVHNDIHFEQDPIDPSAVLDGIAKAATVAQALDSYLPQHDLYKALKAKLAEARKQIESEPAHIGNGPVLKLAKTPVQDERVPLLREKLGLPGERTDTTYDETVQKAVAAFQKKHKIAGNGALNAATIAALNGPRRENTTDVIIANLERWRWMPHDLGKTRVVVNIPDYSLQLIRNDKLYWNTRIVVGKPNLPTPITTAAMKFITVNPTWNVPPSIIANEYLPVLRQDPDALTRIGLKVEQNKDGTVRIYQPPGDANALGRIRFNFPNKFLVYQHDTPDKKLFAHDKRAYSHGCMRVQDPLTYGEKLLSIALPNENYSSERLRKMFGGSEVNINFPTHIPVHLTYQTAFVDGSGKLVIRDDVYGYDAKLIRILKGDERRVADIAVQRAPTGSNISRDALKYNVPGGGNDRAPEFFNPFAALFAPPRPSQPIAQPQQQRQRPAERRVNRDRVSAHEQPNFFGNIFR